jgi:hypothetical protein
MPGKAHSLIVRRSFFDCSSSLLPFPLLLWGWPGVRADVPPRLPILYLCGMRRSEWWPWWYNVFDFTPYVLKHTDEPASLR